MPGESSPYGGSIAVRLMARENRVTTWPYPVPSPARVGTGQQDRQVTKKPAGAAGVTTRVPIPTGTAP